MANGNTTTPTTAVTGNENAFLATLSQSQQVVAQLQALYGSMNPNSLQFLRKSWWSYLPYPNAGASQFNFFGQALGNGATTSVDTNMPLAGTFGTSAFLIKSIEFSVQIDTAYVADYTGLDATMLAADYLNGFVQAGVFQFYINSKLFSQINKPFLYAPEGDGAIKLLSAGQVSVTTDRYPSVDLSRRSDAVYIMDPEIFIEAQTNFQCAITYESGPVPFIAQTLVTAGMTPRIGCRLDGIVFRPTQ
jgi:hypothetical protein